MKTIDNKVIQNAWNEWSDNYFNKSDRKTEIEFIKSSPNKVFPTKVWARMTAIYPSFKGVKVLVPSSGDNKAVYAFHVLGAKVTSCDISEKQIENAKMIADEQNWNINFQVIDSMDLSRIEDRSYDLVYTSNGVHVWISDLTMMYSGFYRILRNNGHYIFFDTHPFIRPFNDNTNELKIERPYGRILKEDSIPNYYWRVQDIVNFLIESGFSISSMDELFAEKDILGAKWWDISEWDEKADININPYAALPQWISLCLTKRV